MNKETQDYRTNLMQILEKIAVSLNDISNTVDRIEDRIFVDVKKNHGKNN